MEALLNTTKFTDDPYFLSLVTGSLINLNRKSEAFEIAKRL